MRSSAALAWCLACPLAAIGCSPAGGAADAGTSCPSDLPASCPSDVASYQAKIRVIIEQRCLACHGPGGVADSKHDLATYDRVYAQRSAILNQAYACQMPPSTEPPLSSMERAALLGWLVCQAPNN
jgi:mono/diheme cytochrome c family protein